ncbi:MAG: GNAT family N-acetyltransferase [Gemmatimonadaceae bacterium]|jgi:RimJ/RimL family protein N-acetyltransferase|nr:GNAT family N-acetyltransferase [Gemmatimonadaceae bacterium]
MQPILQTPRLDLRPAALADADALWALWTDPAVRRFLWDDRVISPIEAADTLGDCLALAPKGLGLWVAEARDADAVVGCAGLLPVSTAASYDPRLAGLVEPLVALTPAVWGRGYAGEMLDALLAHAAGALGLARLAAVTDVPNVASDRMLQRAGFDVLGEVPGPRYRLRTYLWHAPPSSDAVER